MHAVYPQTVFKAIIENDSIDIGDKLEIFANYDGEISKTELLNTALLLEPNIKELSTKDEVTIDIAKVSPLIRCLKNKGLIFLREFKNVAKIRRKF